jgi:hypothetical protein
MAHLSVRKEGADAPVDKKATQEVPHLFRICLLQTARLGFRVVNADILDNRFLRGHD